MEDSLGTYTAFYKNPYPLPLIFEEKIIGVGVLFQLGPSSHPLPNPVEVNLTIT